MEQSRIWRKSVPSHFSNYMQNVFWLNLHFDSKYPVVFYSEYIWKDKIVDDHDQDTMEFDIWKRYEFRPELSHGLTGNENVTILHPGKSAAK